MFGYWYAYGLSSLFVAVRYGFGPASWARQTELFGNKFRGSQIFDVPDEYTSMGLKWQTVRNNPQYI
jgi:hypothetical protein